MEPRTRSKSKLILFCIYNTITATSFSIQIKTPYSFDEVDEPINDNGVAEVTTLYMYNRFIIV